MLHIAHLIRLLPPIKRPVGIIRTKTKIEEEDGVKRSQVEKRSLSSLLLSVPFDIKTSGIENRGHWMANK